jgi:hypothetical protein
MAKTTTRRKLPYPELTDPADVPQHVADLAKALDNFAIDDQGGLASRPTSTVENPGEEGRYYYATDNGVLYRDTGTSWVPVNSSTWGSISPSSDLTLNGLYQDLPGTTIEVNPDVACSFRAWSVFDLEISYNKGEGPFAVGTLNLDSSDQVTNAILLTSVAEVKGNLRMNVMQVYNLVLSAGSHKVKMRAKLATGGGTAKCYKSGTVMQYELRYS